MEDGAAGMADGAFVARIDGDAGLAPAKINLCLHVIGKRPDGYHLLDSLVAFAAVHDRVSVEPAEKLSLEISGAFAGGLDAGAGNLVLRAATALAEVAGIRPHGRLRLEKSLPVASGIGGGSADAAATLRVLSAFWGISLPEGGMSALAARLGADVPVCLDRTSCRMGGIGDVLGAAPSLPNCGIVLVNPGVAVATADVFRARAGAFSQRLSDRDTQADWRDADDMASALAPLVNDLELPAIAMCPEIGEALRVLERHPGILLARMSGSGATCFGICRNPADAALASASLTRPGWWVWGGGPWRRSASSVTGVFTHSIATPNDGTDWGVAKR